VEASALPASVGLARTRISIGASLLRLRSDEQLVSLFRAGNDEAFRVIHDRYRARLFAYARQMLGGSRQDAEDALQDILVRAYAGLRANDRQLALRAWLYRVAHNRCVDELRRPAPPLPETMECVRPPVQDPSAKFEQREALRRLIADVQRLPEQQRSALLMRELAGMAYADMAGALGVTVPAVKSLLVRARVGLAQAVEARDTACSEIREELILAHDRGVRPSGMARRHIRDCPGCREFRAEVRGVSRQFAALAPAGLGPVGLLAKLLGLGGGAGGGAAAGGAAGTTGAAASAGALAGGAGHVVTLLAAAVVTAGGAVELQSTISAPAPRHAHHALARARKPAVAHAALSTTGAGGTAGLTGDSALQGRPSPVQSSTGSTAAKPAAGSDNSAPAAVTALGSNPPASSQSSGGAASDPFGSGAVPGSSGSQDLPGSLGSLPPGAGLGTDGSLAPPDGSSSSTSLSSPSATGGSAAGAASGAGPQSSPGGAAHAGTGGSGSGSAASYSGPGSSGSSAGSSGN